MTLRVGQGGTVTIPAEYRNGAGALTDPVNPLVSIYDPAGVLQLDSAVPVRDALGTFHYDYTVPAAGSLGIWRAYFTGTVAGIPADGSEYFEVYLAGSAAIGYPTVQELADLLEITIAEDSQQERKAQLLLDGAFWSIRNEAKQTITPVDNHAVELHCGPGRYLYLPERPVRAVASIDVEDEGLIVEANYRWTRRGRVTRLDSRWWAPLGGTVVEVVYSHGFDQIPGDLKEVALSAAARSWENPEALKQESLGSYSSTYDGPGLPLTRAEARMCRRYRPKDPA